jgi:AcrR family transcriptional regulator
MNDPVCTTAKGSSRADAQRDRVLCAALKCFVEEGFHAASMASIAAEAQMSVGLIYRYFANKQAIVLAIVEQQLEEKRTLIRRLQSSAQLTDDLVKAFAAWCVPGPGSMSIALSLEMSAEATRNPEIAAALLRSDRSTRAEFQEWLCRGREQGGMAMSRDAAATRALAVRIIVDGLTLRAAREPGLDLDELRRALQVQIAHLLA